MTVVLSALGALADLPSEPFSPFSYPSPNATGLGGWEVAIGKARRFISQLTLEEKVSICTGNRAPGPR